MEEAIATILKQLTYTWSIFQMFREQGISTYLKWVIQLTISTLNNLEEGEKYWDVHRKPWKLVGLMCVSVCKFYIPDFISSAQGLA